jgi:hypothetical protein
MSIYGKMHRDIVEGKKKYGSLAAYRKAQQDTKHARELANAYALIKSVEPGTPHSAEFETNPVKNIIQQEIVTYERTPEGRTKKTTVTRRFFANGTDYTDSKSVTIL